MDKHHSKNYFKFSHGEASHKLIIFTCILISLFSLLYVLYSYRASSSNPQIPQKPSSTPPAVFASQLTTANVESSDGNWQLEMTEEKGKNSTNYTFTIVNETDSSSKVLLSQAVSTTTVMSIPLNTFSPDDKYVFLKETDGGQNSYLVLTTTGANITKDSQTLEISSLFAAKYQNYKITDVTGWGGLHLIVFNTDKVEGGQGPSFWFEVPSKAIIPLGTRFN